MIERKFSNQDDELFGHQVAISDCGEWGVARSKIFSNIMDVVNIYEYFEEKGYDFKLSVKDTLYFRRKKK